MLELARLSEVGLIFTLSWLQEIYVFIKNRCGDPNHY